MILICPLFSLWTPIRRQILNRRDFGEGRLTTHVFTYTNAEAILKDRAAEIARKLGPEVLPGLGIAVDDVECLIASFRFPCSPHIEICA